MGIGVITIRAFESSDVPEAVALEEANRPHPWTEEIFMDQLAVENGIYLVADDERVVGFGGVMVVGETAQITNLLVAAERQRQGIGRRLMVGLIKAAIARGARHLTLEVRSENEAARGLYASLGVAPVGARPGYYGDDDALIMWAHDIDSPDYADRLR